MKHTLPLGLLCMAIAMQTQAQQVDSVLNVKLSEITVNESHTHLLNTRSPLHIDALQADIKRNHFNGNLVQTLSNIPGVQSMDIGTGFAKPMIRGMAFNRILVIEDGIKHEGQQWGADHGLEIDAFESREILVRKGPSSLLYGSDAIGGAIEIMPFAPPANNIVAPQVTMLFKSVNNTVGTSAMVAARDNKWYGQIRISGQSFGDYHINTDTIEYLTIKIPIHNEKLKNTAGFEHHVNAVLGYKSLNFETATTVANSYQKMGMFPGAHGIPDLSRLTDDNNQRNIELPYSNVNHLRITQRALFKTGNWKIEATASYQRNFRQEWSLFHTHYSTQPVPANNANKELQFVLNTYNLRILTHIYCGNRVKNSFGIDLQAQHNDIAGYSFLLPQYSRQMAAAFATSEISLTPSLTIVGGVRCDFGHIDITGYVDNYLAEDLKLKGYNQLLIDQYKQRCYDIDREFTNMSYSAGVAWSPQRSHTLQLNLGRSFRLPGANELASNGVHHGTFRHERGDTSIKSEQGWQADLSYSYESDYFVATLSPFANLFSNYIYLKPTGEWSILPHAGQVYRYTQTKATISGIEAAINAKFNSGTTYTFTGEYIRTLNRTQHSPLAFSPQSTMNHNVTQSLWRKAAINFECKCIAKQSDIDHNEEITDGAVLFNLGAQTDFNIGKANCELTLSVQNIFDRKYYNHVSFYRKIEIPEQGRNIQLVINIQFINKLTK